MEGLKLFGEYVGRWPSPLDASLNADERFEADELTLSFEALRVDHHVHQRKFIFEQHEHHAVGTPRPLATYDETRDGDALALAPLAEFAACKHPMQM